MFHTERFATYTSLLSGKQRLLGLDYRSFREAKHGVEKSGVTNLIKLSISSSLLCLQVLHTKVYFIIDKSKMTKLKFSDIYINK